MLLLIMRKKEYKNKAIELAPDSYVFIPRMEFFKSRNLASKVHKSKKFKSRKKLKQEFQDEIKEYF